MVYSKEACIVRGMTTRLCTLPATGSHRALGTVSCYHGKVNCYKNVPCSRLIFKYNYHRGGVDLMDNAEKSYATTTRYSKSVTKIICTPCRFFKKLLRTM